MINEVNVVADIVNRLRSIQTIIYLRSPDQVLIVNVVRGDLLTEDVGQHVGCQEDDSGISGQV